MSYLQAISTLLLMLWLKPLAAQEPVVLVIGLEQQQYSPHYYHRNGVLAGYGREVFDAFAEYSGYQVEYKVFPVDELFQQLISRQIDFKYPDNPYWQHPLKTGVRMAYSDAVAPYVDGVSMLKSRQGAGLSELKRLGILKGFTPLNYQSLADSGRLQLVSRGSLELLFELLFKGKIDGIYGNVDVVQALAKARYSDNEGLYWNQQLPYVSQSYRASTAAKPRLIKSFNRFLVDRAELIQQLQTRYQIFGLDHPR